MIQRQSILAPSIAFAAPALLSILYTFVLNHFDRGLVWDSAHYVLSSNSLLTWLSQCLQGHYSSPAHSDLGISLMVDGPVLPAFGAILILIGKVFGASPEVSILSGESLVCGLNSVLLYSLGRRLGAGRKLSLIAALILGFDPATIVSASQFLTEQLTVTTLLTFCLASTWALPRGKLNTGEAPIFFQYAAYIIMGGLCTLILHLKTALFPSLAIVMLLVLLARKNSLRLRANIVVAMAMGFVFVLIPWLIFSKIGSSNGRITLAPNRVPSINLAVGMDLPSDAWGVAPPTESVMPIIFDKPSAIIVSLWQGNQIKMIALFLRKISRLFAFSWNDFGWTVLGLDWQWQCFLQRLLLCGALLGTVYLLFQERLLHNRLSALSNVDFLKLTILLMVASHLIFVPFETQPRYGYSAVPFLILLTLIGAQKLRKAQRLPYLYIGLSLLLVILSFSDLSGPLYTYLHTLELTQTAIYLVVAFIFALLVNAAIALARGKTQSLKEASIICTSVWALATAVLCLQSIGTPPPEWACDLPAGDNISRCLQLPPNQAVAWRHNLTEPKSWVAALIDSDENLDDATISLNGAATKSTPVALLDVEQAYPFQSTIKELQALAARTRGQKESSLRQWRLVQLPVASLLPENINQIKIDVGKKPLRVWGQYRYASGAASHKLWLPSLYGFSALRLSILGDNRTTDSKKRRVAVSGSGHNLIQKDNFIPAETDLAPARAGEQVGDYRIYLVLANYQPLSVNNNNNNGKANGSGKDRAGEQAKAAPVKAAPVMTFKDCFVEVF